MAWIYLIIAGCVEVGGVIGIKKVSEKDNWFNNLILFGSFLVSFYFLSLALEEISLSIAYAVWTGIGTIGSTIVGILFFQESKNPIRIFCIIGIIFTIVSLKLIS